MGLQTLKAMYGFPEEVRPAPASHPESREQYLWRLARGHKDLAQASVYLRTERALPEAAVQQWQGRAFGYSDYRPTEGTEHHSPAVVFPVTDGHGHVLALNLRYLALDYAPKSRLIGKAEGGFFYPESKTPRSPVVCLVESAIDALTLNACGVPTIA